MDEKELTEKKPETTDFYDRIMKHLEKRMLFHDELGPPSVCSIGSIIANLKQREEPFHWVSGDDEDLGLNLTFVAPSGLAKSYCMKQFLHRSKGICPLKSVFRGKITEAGFIGTRTKEGDEELGDAFHYREGILAFNEITNLFFTQQQEHSSELINQVMEALSERHVSKRLASGPIEYDTWVTIWGGVQPKRFDFSQGLGRRFLHVSRNWTEDDLNKLKYLRLNRDEECMLDLKEVQRIRDELSTAVRTFDAKEVKWHGSILKYILDSCESHLQMQLVEKAIIGKEVIDQYESDVLIIRDSVQNKDLVNMILRMQQMVAEGSDVSLLINVLRDLSGGNPISLGKVWEKFKLFNYTLSGFQELVDVCTKLKVVFSTYQESRQFIQLRKDLQREREKAK